LGNFPCIIHKSAKSQDFFISLVIIETEFLCEYNILFELITPVIFPFKSVSGNLENWARFDRWVERRAEFQETIRSRVQKVLVSEVVQIQMDQLKDLQKLFDKLFKKVLKGVEKLDVETASLPSLISAVVKLAELLHEWRLSLGELVAPKMVFDGKETTAQIPVKPDLSFEETRAAAKYLIKLRREQVRNSAQKDSQEDYTENMKIPVKGESQKEVIEGQ